MLVLSLFVVTAVAAVVVVGNNGGSGGIELLKSAQAALQADSDSGMGEDGLLRNNIVVSEMLFDTGDDIADVVDAVLFFVGIDCCCSCCC